MLDYSKSFIEVQFPVSKISKESYKERKAVQGQTLTGLGKWWGRKPLILVRAILLGVLLPVSSDHAKDRDIFLKILTMDEEGLYLRKSKQITIGDMLLLFNDYEIEKYLRASTDSIDYSKNRLLKFEDKEFLQRLAFSKLSYDEKLKYCLRPEEIKITDKTYWDQINDHLETEAYSIEELIYQIGIKRFGRIPRVGDCFSGGGSIPFETARIGAHVFASDLNPISVLLTWSSLNIIGAAEDEYNKIIKFREELFESVFKFIDNLGIEKSESGDKADAYLYCSETICPECGWKVPLASTWIIGKGHNVVADLVDDNVGGFTIDVKERANGKDFIDCEKNVTVVSGNLRCPHCKKETPISSIRNLNKKDTGPREWSLNEYKPLITDVFQERLYAIRYVREDGTRYYVAPNEHDIKNENKIEDFMKENFIDWQLNGFLPSSRIDDGDETSRLSRERGWKYWHQLFNPRQLLLNGCIAKFILEKANTVEELAIGILALNKSLNWNSKLSRWDNGNSPSVKDTFYNQAFNTLYNYSSRASSLVESVFNFNIKNEVVPGESKVELMDAKSIDVVNDIWITDPPYADAVSYHELTEFFLAWNKKLIDKAFPSWYTDSKRVLAVKGTGEEFNKSMIDIYANLANHMSDDGYQVVMFTHQDVKVWSELAMVLWSAGLQVVSAWNIATETESGGLKSGNYVKGTVLLTLKKQNSSEIAFEDDLYDEIKTEVIKIIDSMKNIDDRDEPDFNDGDYLLSSYAASLKVLTKYREIDGFDMTYYLSNQGSRNEQNPVEDLINRAVRIAYDYLIPQGFDKSIWSDLKPEERFFLRSIEAEKNGNTKLSTYQELAKGFGVKDYPDMFSVFKANQVKVKTPSDFRMSNLGTEGFGSTVTRHLLVAINEVSSNQSTESGIKYLKDVYRESNDYYVKKEIMDELLSFISDVSYVSHMSNWHKHSYSAKILKEALKNDGV